MLQIEKVLSKNGTRYFVIGISMKEKTTLASVSSLEKAGCLLRFLSGASIKDSEYSLAVETMREIDREENERKGD